MKKLFLFLLISLITNSFTLYSRIYEESIKNKIKSYFFKNSNLKISDSQIIIKDSLPSYNLYEITVLKNSIKTNKSDINIKIKVTDFFKKDKYKLINCKILSIVPPCLESSDYQNNNVIGKEVKIIYENDKIVIYDTGKIIQILNNNIYLIKNSFNQKVKCIKIKNNLFKIIK